MYLHVHVYATRGSPWDGAPFVHALDIVAYVHVQTIGAQGAGTPITFRQNKKSVIMVTLYATAYV